MGDRKLHINPLKRRTVLVANPDSGEMEEKKEPMGWEDAAKVSVVLMLAQVFMAFLPLYGYQTIMECLHCFCYDLLQFCGATFFASFIALTGLSHLASS